jgi:hypothetical protein
MNTTIKYIWILNAKKLKKLEAEFYTDWETKYLNKKSLQPKIINIL